jgi:hypothetical protein
MVVLVSIATAALLAGVLLYLTDRPGGLGLMIHHDPIPRLGSLFGSAGLWLPSFLHTFAFSLLTAAALPRRATWHFTSCLAWFAINAAFEIGQHPQVAPALTDALHTLFGSSAIGSWLQSYFVSGSFGFDDLAAAASGALVAGVVLQVFMSINGRRSHAY